VVQLKRFKKLATFAGTFSVALLIGYVMQYDDADASRYSAVEATSSRMVSPAEIDTSPLQQMSRLEPKVLSQRQSATDKVEAIRFDEGSVKLTALVSDRADMFLSSTSAYTNRIEQGDTETCPVELETKIDKWAMVTIAVKSPCRPDMAFEVQHSGLVVSGLTDNNGQSVLSLPAFEVSGSFTVTLEDGSFTSTSVFVPEANDFRRVVLQWADKPGTYMQFHDESAPRRGHFVSLGIDTGASNRFAEVYTLPAASEFAVGLQDLTVQAEVTQATCAGQFLAERMHVLPGEETDRKDIRITLPSCDYAGTYLELKKVLGGQTLLP